MLDRFHVYTRSRLEAVLGAPPVAINGRERRESAEGWGYTSSGGDELFVQEEPIAGSPYWLIWKCERSGATGACWAVSNPTEDAWRLVMLCSVHNLHDPYRGRTVREHDVGRKDAWVEAFWKDLAILDGLERNARSTADYHSYRITLEPCDRENVRDVELARFVVSSQLEASAIKRFAFSVLNCKPRYATLLVIKCMLEAAVVEMWLDGEPEPVQVRLSPNRAERTLFGQTSGGRFIAIESDDTKDIKRIRAL